MNLSFATLKEKQRNIRDSFPEPLGLRVHRALSWCDCAEQAGDDDDDSAFIFSWISFNAAYAHEVSEDTQVRERTLFDEYFGRLTDLDSESRVFNVIWNRFPQEIRLILENRYVFQPYWKYLNGVPGNEDWERWFEQSTRAASRALGNQDTKKILSILFDRLYVLRNQLIHGGATWKSSVNRDQVRDGRRILGSLVPLFIDIMMDNPSVDWGAPYYPVVD